MRVLVCGGREFRDEVRVNAVLDAQHGLQPITLIIQGGASGADALAGHWARANKVKQRVFEADWARYGRAAGGIRNQQMLDEAKPDLVVSFPGGPGTTDMVNRAVHASVEVRRQ